MVNATSIISKYLYPTGLRHHPQPPTIHPCVFHACILVLVLTCICSLEELMRKRTSYIEDRRFFNFASFAIL